MNIEATANIAVTAAFEALEMMAKKAGVDAGTIMNAVITDPNGNTARYFNDLVTGAITRVPAMLAAA